MAREPNVQAALERLDDIGVLATTAVIDFDTIAAITGQPVEWIVPAGSVS